MSADPIRGGERVQRRVLASTRRSGWTRVHPTRSMKDPSVKAEEGRWGRWSYVAGVWCIHVGMRSWETPGRRRGGPVDVP